MNALTLGALAAFPEQLEAFYTAIPEAYRRWEPESWEGIPSEMFSPIGQVCHVRDIEIDGYHQRFQRPLREDNPVLPSIDGYLLAKERDYASANADKALAAFRAARAETVQLISGLGPAQLLRTAMFEGFGPVTVQSLIHILSSHDLQHLAGLQWLLGKIEALRAEK
jgi:DinB family protein